MLSARVGKNKLGYPQNYSLARWYHLRTADHQSPHPVYIQRQGRREQERGEEEERGELQA